MFIGEGECICVYFAVCVHWPYGSVCMQLSLDDCLFDLILFCGNLSCLQLATNNFGCLY